MGNAIQDAAKGIAGDLASPVYRAAQGIAGTLAGQSVMEAAGGAVGFGRAAGEGASIAEAVGMADAVSFELVRGPFSLPGIAERIAGDPEYYERLARFAASELDREIDRFAGQGNSQEIIRGELVRLQTGFTDLTKHIGAKAYDKAAEVITSLREGLASWYATHPALVETIEKLSVISLATFVLTAVGVPPVLGVLVSATIANNEKLADVLKFWKKD